MAKFYAIKNQNGNYLRWLKEGIWNKEGKGCSKNRPERIYKFSERGCRIVDGNLVPSKTIVRALEHLKELGWENLTVVDYPENEVVTETIETENGSKMTVSLPIIPENVSEEMPVESEEDEDPNVLLDGPINETCAKCVNSGKCAQPKAVELIQCPDYKKQAAA